MADFIGRGVAFPMGVDRRGRVASFAGSDLIAQSIRAILSTARGERVMRPEFGCAIWDLLFDPIDQNTLGLMAECARDALAQWEPRIVVDDIVATADAHQLGQVLLEVGYRERDTNDRRNLVFPFYVIPEE